jgi:glutathione-specific gamma-glutamylcyclotransferase
MDPAFDHIPEDLWVFAYGSLMWDPGIVFAEVRRAFVPGNARRFILRDIHGARGTRETPGLMAALDEGSGCEGLAFRIDREHVDGETERLWRRERIGPGYIASFVDAELSDGRVSALTFVADHDAEVIASTLTRAEQVHCFATGTGFLGTSLQYLENIAAHFEALGIHDDDVVALLRETKAYMRTLEVPSSPRTP